MRIAIDTLSAKSLYHGMGIYIFNLLKHIMSIDNNNKFIIYKKPEVFSGLFLNDNDRVQIRNINKNRLARISWEYAMLPKILKKEKIDVFWGPSNFLPITKTCKYVVTIHDLSSFTYAQAYPWLRRKYYQYNIKQAVKRADFIITDSEFSKQDIIKYFRVPQEKIRVIYCGIDAFFKKVTANDTLEKVKKKYQLPDEFILTLSVLEPKKNTERLLQAYSQLIQQKKNLPKLVIGGSKKYGWKNEKIFLLVDALKLTNSIVFTDFIEYEDLVCIYSMAKLFILPSLYEGFGLPVVEAMACGTPVITSNTSSLPEVVGNAAVLVNPYNINDIANAIDIVLNDENKQKEMIKKGYENVKRFKWEKSAKELIAVFEEIYQKG